MTEEREILAIRCGYDTCDRRIGEIVATPTGPTLRLRTRPGIEATPEGPVARPRQANGLGPDLVVPLDRLLRRVDGSRPNPGTLDFQLIPYAGASAVSGWCREHRGSQRVWVLDVDRAMAGARASTARRPPIFAEYLPRGPRFPTAEEIETEAARMREADEGDGAR